MAETINIAFSCNNQWADKLAVTMVSTLIHASKDDFYKFFILDGGITEENKKKFAKIKSKTNFKIEYIPVNKELFSNAPLSHHFTIETYYRLKLPSLIDVDKLLYLDVDTLVKKDLKELYNIDINNYYAGAVIDESSYSQNIHKLSVKRYFNAGMLLLNLKKIREDKLEDKFFEFIDKHSDLISYVDQCVLNAVFNENVKFLDRRFNLQHHSALDNINEKYQQQKKEVIVLHYVAQKKPWNFEKPLDLIFEYLAYALKTPYKYQFCRNMIIEFFKKVKILLLLLT